MAAVRVMSMLASVLFSRVKSDWKACRGLPPALASTDTTPRVAELPLLWRAVTGAAKVAAPLRWYKANTLQSPDMYWMLTGPRAVRVARSMYMPAVPVLAVLLQVVLVMVVVPSSTTAVPLAACMAGPAELLLVKVLLCSQALPLDTNTTLLL
jgi:hypothetical protein